MKNNLPVEMKVNIWDFIDIDKLNEFTDGFLGEVVLNINYTIMNIDEDGELLLMVDCESEV